MSHVVLLDTGPLGMYANPGRNPKNEECRRRVNELIGIGTEVRASGLAVYESRRELILLQLNDPKAKRLVRFDIVVRTLGLIPITHEAMEMAMELWAQVRHANWTAPLFTLGKMAARGIRTYGDGSLPSVKSGAVQLINLLQSVNPLTATQSLPRKHFSKLETATS